MKTPDSFVHLCVIVLSAQGFPGSSVVKSLPTNAGDMDLVPGSGRSPGEGNGNLLQYSCLGNPMDRGVWWAVVQGVAKKVRHDLETKQQKPVHPRDFQYLSITT